MLTTELHALLRQLYAEHDEKLRTEYSRSLPLQDGLIDRWVRARRLHFAEGTSIYNSSLVFGDVMVGEQSWIGPFVMLDGSGGGLSIGAYCSISCGVQIYTHDTVLWALSRGQASKRQARVEIGDCVHIGASSIVLPGVTIGERCVVAANSLVNRDVRPNTVVGGTPARVLGRVIGDGADVAIEWSHSGATANRSNSRDTT